MIMSTDVLQLAASGARIPAIARALRVSESDAVDQLLSAVKAAAEQALDHDGSKQVELAHLDMLRQALSPLALRGDIGAARLLVRIHTARALLLGLIDHDSEADAPPEGVNELAQIRERRDARRMSSES
jgi:hypothetical protein